MGRASTGAVPPQGIDRGALAAVMLAVSLVTLDLSMTQTALPAIAAGLQVVPAQAIWAVNAYQLAVVAALLPFAALAERLGARRVHLFGLAFFVLASLASASCSSLPALAVARALQGLGAAATMSVNIALVRQLYPPQQLGRGVGLNALAVGVTFAMGPAAASLLLGVAPWPALYLLNLPLGLLAFVIALRRLPHSRPQAQPFDALAALLAAGTFGAALAALVSAAQRGGWPLPTALTAMALAAGPRCCAGRRGRRHRCCRWTCCGVRCLRCRWPPRWPRSRRRGWPSCRCPSSSSTCCSAMRCRPAS